MTRIGITLVPVALKPAMAPGTSPSLGVSMFRPGGEWLSTTLSASGDVVGTAHRLAREFMHPNVEMSDPENAGVIYRSGVPNLLITMVLPIAAVELSMSPDDWRKLTPWTSDDPMHAELRRVDPVQIAMISYWREQLTRTTAALDFLPKYFPASQVRSAYASVWGENPSEGNFQRWFGSALDSEGDNLGEEVSDSIVRQENQSEFANRLVGEGLTAARVAAAWDPKVIGLSAGVVALAGIASLPVAAAAGALAGAAIGWQGLKGAGRPPTWYRRAKQGRIALKTTYPVRPGVSRFDSTFIRNEPEK